MSAGQPALSPELQLSALVRGAVGWDRVVVVLARDVDTRAALRGSDTVLEHYCDLQQTLLQGPSLDAFTSGTPVLVDDLRGPLPWSLLSASTPADLPVRSLAVLPLLAPSSGVAPPDGPARPVLGVLSAGRDRVEPFTPVQVATLAHLAGVLSAVLVHRASTGELVALDADPSDDLAVVAGMLQERLGASGGEALSRMRAHAFTSGRTLNELAQAVLAGHVAVDEVAGPL